MLLAQIGAALLLAALALGLMSALVGFSSGYVQDPLLAPVARRAFYAMAALVVAASAVLIWALLSRDFALAYVTEHTDRALSLPLTAAAFYGGQEGSLLYWLLCVCVLGSVSLAAAAHLGVRLGAYATGFLALICVFFLIMLVLVETPFALLSVVPTDGLGLNPVLRDGGMLIHPPFMLAGFSSYAVPFSFAMATLLAGRQDAAWMRHTRRIALIGWGLQGVGLMLGMWWAYHVLGWGGYWGWDPVENVALLPWLATTAYLHSIQVQERRGQLRVWNLFLVILAFLLSIFGTYIVRSGIVASVHSFAVSPLGPWFYGFLAICVVASGVLLAWRGPMLKSAPLRSPISREGAYLAQNVIIVGITAAIFWGTVLPLVTGMFGTPLVVGAPYYDRAGAPLFVLLLLLLAIGPSVPWARAGRTWLRSLRWPLLALVGCLCVLLALGQRGAGPLIALPLLAAALAGSAMEFWRGGRYARRLGGGWPHSALRLARRRRRHYGAHLAHIGFIVAVVGIAGSHFWQSSAQVDLNPGQSVTVSGYHLVYQGLSQARVGDHLVTAAHLSLGDESLQPEQVQYASLGQQTLPRVAIRSTPWADLYLVLDGTSGQRASLTIFVNPLVTWIWVGIPVMVLGLILGNVGSPPPELETEPATLKRARPAVAHS